MKRGPGVAVSWAGGRADVRGNKVVNSSSAELLLFMATPGSKALISRFKYYLVWGQREPLPMKPKAVRVNELNSHILGPGSLKVSLVFSMNLTLGRNSEHSISKGMACLWPRAHNALPHPSPLFV